MSDELMNRARDLLALRDKATPGPWDSGGCRPAGTVHGGNGDWFVANCGDSANAQVQPTCAPARGEK